MQKHEAFQCDVCGKIGLGEKNEYNGFSSPIGWQAFLKKSVPNGDDEFYFCCSSGCKEAIKYKLMTADQRITFLLSCKNKVFQETANYNHLDGVKIKKKRK